MVHVICVGISPCVKKMSWIVEVILLDRYGLPENPTVDFVSTDIYNATSSVENAIDELLQSGVFDVDDVIFLDRVSSIRNFKALENALGTSRNTLSKRFRELCNIISFYLGGWYTDEGFLEYFQEKYDLEDHHVDLAREFMESNERYSKKRERFFTRKFLERDYS